MAEKDDNSNEFSSFLIKHSDLDNLEVLVPDMNGILRGKRINVAESKTLYKKGINLPAGTHLLDSGGNV
ncbi:MAG TPA: glutamine synthetase, partial [Cytophagales bacterium]|nr:glutamine synthetase [Cytophagales bacterium]